LAMTEIDREEVLFQRSEEMARLKERDLAQLVKIRDGKEGVRRSKRDSCEVNRPAAGMRRSMRYRGVGAR
jgi:hypothetical protein